jgi:nitroimidazol reductase NimA-like FMN-containing flavoprotein (pyridoxamine 5'-phosphate oxidase superfamily)
MIEVREMSDKEIVELLSRVGYGHLACSRDDQPYLVPIHYAFKEPNIYVYTTEGKKSEIIAENPRICLQVEDVQDNAQWKSVILNGEAERLTDEDKREAALQAIVAVNPTLTPAVSIRWMDNWVRENIEVIYLIKPKSMTGRTSVSGSETSHPLTPSKPNIQ